MLKKIILGIIIGAVVLTAGAGGIYAYHKNSNPADEFAVTNNESYGTESTNSNFTGNGNNQFRLQQGEREQINCPDGDCPNQDCSNKDCTEQHCSRENNCYRYNNDENGCQNCNNFCYRNISENQYNNENCLQNGKGNNSGNNSGNNVKNNIGKNK